MLQGRNQGCTTPKRPFRRLAVIQCAALLAASIAAHAGDAPRPVDSFEALAQTVMTCWKPPDGSEGSEITLRFGLTGQGALRGPPMVTYSRLIGSKELQRAFALSAMQAVADCTPVKLTDGFGRIVAQRVLTLRFTQPPKGRQSIERRMNRYAIVVFWSDEDGIWIAEAPDLKPCSAHGDTPEQAVAELQVAMGLWLEVAHEHGYAIPEPRFHVRQDAAE